VEAESAGLVVFGTDYSSLSLKRNGNSTFIGFSGAKDADKGASENYITIEKADNLSWIYLRVAIKKGGLCEFSYSLNGKEFKKIPELFLAKPGRWIGAKVGLFCSGTARTNDAGYGDFDWFRVEAIKQ
jgi:hypothetical protein